MRVLVVQADESARASQRDLLSGAELTVAAYAGPTCAIGASIPNSKPRMASILSDFHSTVDVV